MIPGEAIVLAQEIEKFRPYFFEDPVAPDSILSFGEVSEKTRIPMAAGERNLTIWEFREYIESAGVHHVVPTSALLAASPTARRFAPSLSRIIRE